MFTSDKIIIFIFNKINTLYFRNIIFIKRYLNEIASYFTRIKHFNSAYLSLHYVFFFFFK